MFYALIVICALDAPCDLDHAIHATQSAPIYRSEDECVAGARAHLPRMDVPALREGVPYQVDITCETTGAPA